MSSIMRRRRGLISAIGKLPSEGLGFENPQSSQTGACYGDLSSIAAPAVLLCAGHAQQLGGESPLPNLMEVKG